MPTTSLVVPEPGRASEYWRRSRVVTFADSGNLVELIELAPVSGGNGLLVLEIVLLVLTAFSGGTPTISVGDGAGATTWLNAASVTSAGSIRSLGPSSNGKLYIARDRLTATLSASMAAGQAMLLARVVDAF